MTTAASLAESSKITSSPICIAVAGRKGGVAKTGVAVTLASALAERGLFAVIVDLDPQSNASFVLSVDVSARGTASWLLGTRFDEIIQLCPHDANIGVLAGGPLLEERGIMRLDPNDLAKTIERTVKELSSSSKRIPDVFIFDCPPGGEHLERLAMRAADTLLVAMNAHPLALIGGLRVVEDVYADRSKNYPTPKRVAAILTMLNATRRLDQTFDDTVSKEMPDMPRFFFRQDVECANAMADGMPLFKYNSKCKAAIDMKEIATWIAASIKA